MRISDWSSDVCSSDLLGLRLKLVEPGHHGGDCLLFTGVARLGFLAPLNAELIRDVAELLLLAVNGGHAFQKIDLLLGDNIGVGPVCGPILTIDDLPAGRSEERRVGNECVSTCRTRWLLYPIKKKT